jgi:carbamoyl-phosphate synthase large subunit
MINCNPETVSTDYDTSDRLYFEPLTLEDVLAVVEVEQPLGVIVQFGGQTPLKLAAGLVAAGVPLLGTSVDAIDLAEDRGRFGALLERLGYKAPPYATARSVQRRSVRRQVGFPLLVRPSYVLGGGAMEIVYSRDGPRRLPAPRASPAPPAAPAAGRWRVPLLPLSSPIFLDRFLENAIEVDVDALCDGRRVDRRDHAARRGGRRALRRQRLRAAAALARRGDARADPRGHARDRARDRRRRAAERPVRRPRGELYVIEANPRASRTVPFVSKAVGVPLAKLACRIMLGERIADLGLPRGARGWATASTSRSRRRCCRSTASRAPTRCSARRCARPAR